MIPSNQDYIKKLPEEQQQLITKILRLKKEKNVLILAHNYQREEIQLIADLLGDSLELARKVMNTVQENIIFAGVRFMAETAKVLNPEKRIHFPDKGALCKMASYLNVDMIQEYKKDNPKIPVILYINSTAESKTMADIVCTSSNAIKVTQYIQKQTNAPKVAFGPDKNLGAYISKMVGIPVDIIPPEGNCYVHDMYSVEDIQEAKKKHPNAVLLVHPEAPADVLDQADYIGSTSMILSYPGANPEISSFIIGTEIGVTQRLRRMHPAKKFYPLNKKAVCYAMKKITLDSILECLQKIDTDEFLIELDQNVMDKSQTAIKKMIEIR
jgi:quinolinate synthase